MQRSRRCLLELQKQSKHSVKFRWWHVDIIVAGFSGHYRELICNHTLDQKNCSKFKCCVHSISTLEVGATMSDLVRKQQTLSPKPSTGKWQASSWHPLAIASPSSTRHLSLRPSSRATWLGAAGVQYGILLKLSPLVSTKRT